MSACDAYWIIMHCCSELIGMVIRCSFNCENRNSFIGHDFDHNMCGYSKFYK